MIYNSFSRVRTRKNKLSTYTSPQWEVFSDYDDKVRRVLGYGFNNDGLRDDVSSSLDQIVKTGSPLQLGDGYYSWP